MKQLDFRSMSLGLVGRDPDMLALLREVLIGLGFQVRARLADGFLTTLESQELPALLIYDEAGPEIDAERIYSLLQEYPGWRAVPMLILSDAAEGIRVARCLDRGVQEFIAKPFAVEELAARVRKVLRVSMAMDQQQEADGFSGDLAYMSLPDLMMSMAQNMSSGDLHLTMEDGEYQFTFLRGRLVTLQGPDNVRGRKAFYRAVRLFYGRFVFHPMHEPPRAGGSLQDYGDIPNLILQAVQESDEYPLVRNQLPPEPMMVRLAEEAGEVFSGDFRILRPLLQDGREEATVDELIRAYPKTDAEAARELLKLYQKGTLIPA
jgi:DNA-binding response OmpR family regulator